MDDYSSNAPRSPKCSLQRSNAKQKGRGTWAEPHRRNVDTLEADAELQNQAGPLRFHEKSLVKTRHQWHQHVGRGDVGCHLKPWTPHHLNSNRPLVFLSKCSTQELGRKSIPFLFTLAELSGQQSGSVRRSYRSTRCRCCSSQHAIVAACGQLLTDISAPRCRTAYCTLLASIRSRGRILRHRTRSARSAPPTFSAVGRPTGL